MAACGEKKHKRPEPKPLGHKVDWLEECFPKGCRGRIMMRIMDEQIGYERAKLMVPDLEESTHEVLMKMASGEACGGTAGVIFNHNQKGAKQKGKIIGLYNKNLTTKQIAERLGMTQEMVRKYRRG